MESRKLDWIINKSNGIVSLWSPGMDCVFGVTHDRIDDKTARAVMDGKMPWKDYKPLSDVSDDAVAESNSKANTEAALSPKGRPADGDMDAVLAKVNTDNVSVEDVAKVPDDRLLRFSAQCLGVDLGDMAGASGAKSLRPKVEAIVRSVVSSRAERAAAEKSCAEELEARRKAIEKKTGVKTVIEHRK